MSIQDCANLVAKSDPDRFSALMTVPVRHRAALCVLYAFNLELSRAAWASKEPLIAQMRLQWWHDFIDGDVSAVGVEHSEVAGPMRSAIDAGSLSLNLLHEMIEARVADAFKTQFSDMAELEQYLAHTSAHVMRLAGQCCGAADEDMPALEALGFAHGCAVWLNSYDAVLQAGWNAAEGLQDDWGQSLANRGLTVIEDHVKSAQLSQGAIYAGRAAWMVQPVLKRFSQAPNALLEQPERLAYSPAMKALRLSWATLRRSWC